MSDAVITNVDQINAEWLTRVLQESDALDQGAVESFEVETGQVRLSTNARLRLKYTSAAQGDLPEKLFLKMVNTDLGDESFGESEIQYYLRDYIGLEGAPLIRCYDAAYSEAQRRYHLLLDDLSDTHTVAIYKTPTLDYGLALAEALASLHAHWWGRLDQSRSPIPNAEMIRRYLGMCEPGARVIVEACADALKAHWPEVMLEFYQEYPRLMIERTQNENGFSLIHGDLNGFNILVPKEGNRPIYLIDRQPFDWQFTTWLGVCDFIFPLVIDCEPEMRRQIEKPMLKHYHEQLSRRGVRDYSWEQLWNDYRLSMAMSLCVVTEWNRVTLNVEAMPIWMPMLQRTMTAFDDLDCAALWQK